MDPALRGGIGVDEARCSGCGNCEAVCPGNFELLCRGVERGGTLRVMNGIAVFLSAEACSRHIPESACRLCYDACAPRAVVYPETEGFQRLEAEVVNAGRCSGCGACVAVCRDDALEVEEYPVATGECTNCGFCLVHCPPVGAPAGGEMLPERPLGRCIRLASARTRDERIAGVAQDGGLVTALLLHALRQGTIDAAVVASRNSNWKPVPLVASEEEEIIAGAGTKYTNSPTLAAIPEAREMGFRKLGIVTLPCQSRALEMLEKSEIGRELRHIIALNIALFCMANFHHTAIVELSQRYSFSLGEVRKFAIKGRSMQVTTHGGGMEIPLREAMGYVRPACRRCADFTGIGADISVGAAGSPEGFSTVIVRTRRAERIFQEMERTGEVEVRGVGDRGLRFLLKLALKKLGNLRNTCGQDNAVAAVHAGAGTIRKKSKYFH
ncbi:Coenzyme F420 hydrogenase/dehydrogenase, beta subunit C-terminal domain [Candidatus Pyrohabitans sp.]